MPRILATAPSWPWASRATVAAMRREAPRRMDRMLRRLSFGNGGRGPEGRVSAEKPDGESQIEEPRFDGTRLQVGKGLGTEHHRPHLSADSRDDKSVLSCGGTEN